MRSTCRPVSVPRKIEKAVLNAVELVQACLSVRKELESSFFHSVAPVKLIQACLYV